MHWLLINEYEAALLIEQLQHYLIGTTKKVKPTHTHKKKMDTHLTISGQCRALIGFQLAKEMFFFFFPEVAHSAAR